MLVVCANTPEAEILSADLKFFQQLFLKSGIKKPPVSDSDITGLFPAIEILPYEPLSASIEITAKRI